MIDRRRLQVSISGEVQGVGFRWFVQRLAARLELDGWVANVADGSVEVLAEGTQARLVALLAGLRQGPPSAMVTGVEARWSSAMGVAQGFSIRSGSHPGD